MYIHTIVQVCSTLQKFAAGIAQAYPVTTVGGVQKAMLT